MFGKSKNNATEVVAESTPDVTEEAVADEVRGGGSSNGSGNGGRSSGNASYQIDRSKPTVISEGFSLQGELVAHGVLHVEGFIKGTVQTDVVNIGPRGAVEGKVHCKSLQVKGTFIGTADCDELFIASKARVVGRVTYRTVAIQRGALIEGDLIHAA